MSIVEKRIDSIRSFGIFQDKLLVNNTVDNRLTIYRIDSEWSIFKTLDTEFDSVNYCGKYIISSGLKVFDILKTEWLLNIDNGYYPVLLLENRILCYKYEGESLRYYLFDILNNSWKDIGNIEGVPIEFKEGFIITIKKNSVLCYWNFAFNWEVDVREIGAFENFLEGKQDGYVQNVYTYQNQVIVLAGCGIVSIDLISGKKIWEHKNTQRFTDLLITERISYLNSGVSVAKINIGSGRLYPHVRLNDIVIGNDTILPNGEKLVYHEGKLYFNIHNSGKTVLATISPENFEYLSWEYLDFVKDGICPPVFYKDRVFFKDKSDVLFSLLKG